jgi:hypothetical protein
MQSKQNKKEEAEEDGKKNKRVDVNRRVEEEREPLAV